MPGSHNRSRMPVWRSKPTGQCDQQPLWLIQVLQQLDGEGKARVGKVLRNLPHKSVLVVGQADSYLTRVVDNVDTVVKRNGCSTVLDGVPSG